jgi:hypothetical protein
MGIRLALGLTFAVAAVGARLLGGLFRGPALRAGSFARSTLASRTHPSLDGDDVLAWALARTGHCGEALRFSRRALRRGTRDAPKELHRGMIERCLGHDAQVRLWFRRALDLNPHFSLLWAPVARRYAS